MVIYLVFCCVCCPLSADRTTYLSSNIVTNSLFLLVTAKGSGGGRGRHSKHLAAAVTFTKQQRPVLAKKKRLPESCRWWLMIRKENVRRTFQAKRILQNGTKILGKRRHLQWLSHIAEYIDQPGKVVNPARGQLNRKNEYFPVPARA